MIRPPSITAAIKVPATVALIAGAAMVKVLELAGRDVSPLYLDSRAFGPEPWRLFTSALVHVDLLHLAFNLYWTWTFGQRVETRYGSWRTLLLYVWLAAVSGAAEYAFASGGVGLSGVGYGLFGLLWVAHRRDPALRDAMDRSTAQLFVVWFFLCIGLTVANIFRVGNVAHGVGAAAGALVGWAVTRAGLQRIAPIAIAVAATAAIGVSATFARPWVNFSGDASEEEAREGDRALDAGDAVEAERHYRLAVVANANDDRAWHNLGVALHRQNRHSDAFDAFDRAFAIEPSATHRHAVVGEAIEAAQEELARRILWRAQRHLERAHALAPDDAWVSSELDSLRARVNGH